MKLLRCARSEGDERVQTRFSWLPCSIGWRVTPPNWPHCPTRWEVTGWVWLERYQRTQVWVDGFWWTTKREAILDASAAAAQGPSGERQE